MIKRVFFTIIIIFYCVRVYAGIEFGIESGYSKYNQEHLDKAVEYENDINKYDTNILIHRIDRNMAESLNNLFINFSYMPSDLPLGISAEAGYNGLPVYINYNYFHQTDDITKETILINAYFISAGIFLPAYIVKNKFRVRLVLDKIWGISVYDAMYDYLRVTEAKNSYRFISKNTGYKYGINIDYFINKNVSLVLGVIYQNLEFDNYSDNEKSAYYYENKNKSKGILFYTNDEYNILKKDSQTKEITPLKINFSGINLRIGMRFLF